MRAEGQEIASRREGGPVEDRARHVDVALVGNVYEESGEEVEGVEVVGAGGGPFGFVRDDADASFAGVVVQALERDGGARGVVLELPRRRVVRLRFLT
jgi:hypothetical protein